MIPVILSGGSGTRLWPLSRAKLPKQFCTIFDESLFVKTLKRVLPLGIPITVTSKALENITISALSPIPTAANSVVLAEPTPRNTAPAIALLCHYLALNGKESQVVGVFPADHLIKNQADFLNTIKSAEQMAADGFVVTLGVKPTHPETGYGYIQIEKPNTMGGQKPVGLPVFKFHEKPSLEKAKDFIHDGGYYWNAGIFVFKTSHMIGLLKKNTPKLWQEICKIKPDFSNLADVYQTLPNISIDYAIMERLSEDELRCIPCDIGWDDVGSWDAVSAISEGTDPMSRLVEINSNKNYVHGIKEKVYSLNGVENLVIVDTADALLITKRGEGQKVKDVVEKIKGIKPSLLEEHTYDERPWGRYDVLKDMAHFKSKILTVKMGAQLSYQSHSQREEHWIVIKGLGEVVLDDQLISVRTGSYIKIPHGSKHRLRNTGSEELQIVEVQLGSYFGEDDIVRYQDDYNRI